MDTGGDTGGGNLSKEVTWWAPEFSGTLGSSIAAGGQLGLTPLDLDHPVTGDAVRSTIVGGQCWFNMVTVIDINYPPELFLIVMDSHMAAPPPLTTMPDKAENSDIVWMHAMAGRPGSGSRQFTWQFKLTTKRRLDYNDQLVWVIINREPSNALAATTMVSYVMDFYVLMDL